MKMLKKIIKKKRKYLNYYYNNQSTQNKMINTKNKRNIPNGIFNSNYESALESLKKLDKKKKKFIKKRKFNYK